MRDIRVMRVTSAEVAAGAEATAEQASWAANLLLGLLG